MPIKKKVNNTKPEENEDTANPISPASEGAPAVTCPSDTPQTSTSAAELYAKLQAAVAEDPAKINDFAQEVPQMFVEAEKADTPLLLRVRMLELFARHGQHLRDGNILKKVVTSLVKILSGPDNTQQLMVAAVQGIAALGPVSTLDKKWEYLSREGADVLMQVTIDEEGFAEPVRASASKALDTLVKTAFRSVVAKLLHWLSDDREAEEDEQLQKERRLAMTRLRKLSQTEAFRSQWTEEVQEYVLSLIIRVLSAVTAQEFAQLARIAASLPVVRDKNGLPLITAFLGQNKLNTDRTLESLSIISQYVTAVPYDVTPMLEEAGLLSTPVDGATPKGMWHAKVLLLAAKLATPENTDKMYGVLLEQLMRLLGDGSQLPEYLTTLEALLIGLTVLGQKKAIEFVKQLKDESFTAKCCRLLSLVEKMEPLVIYAVKRMMMKSEAGVKEMEILGACHNLRLILGSFSSNHIPMGQIVESWMQKHKLPVLKRGREAQSGTGAPAVPNLDSPLKPVDVKGRDTKMARTENPGRRGNKAPSGAFPQGRYGRSR
uniref:Uncharacterized protein n=1 Tax=Trypanosoma congolense (strain IL3000) TaxID=1068625 RepID=G0UPN7_TRYCI|nr:conserved hypothetical protein [Trypanosoma congolense IL3000]